MPPPTRVAVLVPVYNEAPSLPELAERLDAARRSAPALAGARVLFVDDGSTDDTRAVLAAVASRHAGFETLRLRRNEGKSLALMAGILSISAETYVTLDGDLQDRPEEIPALLDALKTADMAVGWKRRRRDGWARRAGSAVFNRVVSWVGGLRLRDHNCGLKAFRASVARELCVYGQYHRYIPLLAHFAGFRVAEVPVEHDPRRHGRSKYRLFRWQGFLDLFSLLFIRKYGFSPLYFFGGLGLTLAVPSALLFFYFAVNHALYMAGYRYGFMVTNRPLLVLSFTLILLGVNLFLTGFVCDFVLHHHIQSNLSSVVLSRVERAPAPDPTETA